MQEKKESRTIQVRAHYELAGVNHSRSLASLPTTAGHMISAHIERGIQITSIALMPEGQFCALPSSLLADTKDEKVFAKMNCERYYVVMRIKATDRFALDTAYSITGVDACKGQKEMCWEGLVFGEYEYDPVPVTVLPFVYLGVLLVGLVVMLVVLVKRVRAFREKRQQSHEERMGAVARLIEVDPHSAKPLYSIGPTQSYRTNLGVVHSVPVLRYTMKWSVCSTNKTGKE